MNDDPILDREPVLIILGAAVALVDAAIIAARSLDWVDLTAEQTASIVALVTVVVTTASAVVRSRVTSPASARHGVR